MKTIFRAIASLLQSSRNPTTIVILFFGRFVSFMLMIGLGAVGFAKMNVSILQFAHSTIGEYNGAFAPEAETSAVAVALEGLECLFLAPLGFLLFRGISDYVVDVIEKNAEQASACFLLRVKALILGLMAAIVATDLVKRALDKPGLSYESATMGSLLISILAAYSLCIERNAGAHCNDATNRQQTSKAESTSSNS